MVNMWGCFAWRSEERPSSARAPPSTNERQHEGWCLPHWHHHAAAAAPRATVVPPLRSPCLRLLAPVLQASTQVHRPRGDRSSTMHRLQLRLQRLTVQLNDCNMLCCNPAYVCPWCMVHPVAPEMSTLSPYDAWRMPGLTTALLMLSGRAAVGCDTLSGIGDGIGAGFACRPGEQTYEYNSHRRPPRPPLHGACNRGR